MSFLCFIFYYLICTTILFLILFLIYKFLLHKQFNLISKTAEKEVDKYFNAYDDNIDNDKEKHTLEDTFNIDLSNLMSLINKELQEKMKEENNDDDFLNEVK